MEPSDFEAWWELYPRKTAKRAASRAWDKMDMFQRKAALDGVVVLAASRVGEDPRFCPHPATWLNGHRWEDVPESINSSGDRNGSAVVAPRPNFLTGVEKWERPPIEEQTKVKQLLDDYYNRMFDKLSYWEKARVRHSRKREMDPE